MWKKPEIRSLKDLHNPSTGTCDYNMCFEGGYSSGSSGVGASVNTNLNTDAQTVTWG